MSEVFWGALFGVIWGCCNLWVIQKLLHAFILTKRYGRAFLLIQVKFPLLYGLGYWVLRSGVVNPWSSLVSFSVILLLGSCVAVRKGLGDSA